MHAVMMLKLHGLRLCRVAQVKCRRRTLCTAAPSRLRVFKRPAALVLQPVPQVMSVPQGGEWASGILDVCAEGFGGCFMATFCGACMYADLKQEVDGASYFMSCLSAMLCVPCYVCCWHPELRTQIAVRHGKNVSQLTHPFSRL